MVSADWSRLNQRMFGESLCQRARRARSFAQNAQESAVSPRLRAWDGESLTPNGFSAHRGHSCASALMGRVRQRLAPRGELSANVEPRAGCWDQPCERREAGRATLWELAECGAKLRSYSGMHGSWLKLNQVEIATSLFSRQCLGHAGSGIELLCGRKGGCGTAE